MRRVILALASFAIAACSGANFGTLGAKEKDDVEPPEESEGDGADDAGDAAEPEGTDVPTWINGSYLTCDWQGIGSKDDVKIRCGVYGPDGSEELPGSVPLTVDWSMKDENDKPVDVANILQSGDPKAHIVSLLVPIDTFAAWTLSAVYSAEGASRTEGKTLLESLKGKNEELDACFAQGVDSSACFSDVIDKSGGAESFTYGESTSSGDSTNGGSLGDAHRVFATSEAYTGNLGGRAGADLKCQTLADAASLGGKWKAILATAGTTVQANLTLTKAIANLRPAAAGGPELVALSIDAIEVFGSLEAAVRFDEHGAPVNAGVNTPARNVWTGAKGTGQVLTGLTCSDWTSEVGRGGQGGSSRTSTQWLKLAEADCTATASLYCIDGQ